MVVYIFWPKHLKSKELHLNDDNMCAISICLQSTDHIVLDIVPRRLLEKEALSAPYSIIGTKNSGEANWKFGEANDYCTIEFYVPNLKVLQFFSLEPIPLTQLGNAVNTTVKKADYKNFEKLCNHPRYQSHDDRLRRNLSLLNLFDSHHESFVKRYHSLHIKSVNVSARLGTMMRKKCRSSPLRNIVSTFTVHLVVNMVKVAYSVSSFLNWRYTQLVNISVLAQQIDLRAQQICYFPVQYLLINEHHSIGKTPPKIEFSSEDSSQWKEELPCKYYPDYIRFYNTVWLILNDISFGMIVGSLVYDHADQISMHLHRAIGFSLYHFPKAITISLSNNPLGIKLNHELAKFFSELFLWVIEFSNVLFVGPMIEINNLKCFLRVVSQLGCVFGGTFALSIIVDYFAILTFHIYTFHRISSKLYHWQLVILLSLFHLFRGKKNNILRNRIDHNYFKLDQLLLGTIFFIILVFLLPTVLMFYLFFTTLRMVTIDVEIFLESIIALLNHFPLFALLLRLKDPKRIPGGITMNELGPGRLDLKSKPIKISEMFKPFVLLMEQMKDIYFSSKTSRQIFLGLPFVTHRRKLYQILYSSLPSTPIDIRTFRNKLSPHIKKKD